jgi:hypothetical protein
VFHAAMFGWKMQPVAGMSSAMVDTGYGAGDAGSIGDPDRNVVGMFKSSSYTWEA